MIGSNISIALVNIGIEVIGVDNLERGEKKNIQLILDANNFTFRYSDISSDSSWACDMNKEDIVIHTADVVAGIGYVFENEWRVFKRNIQINSFFAETTLSYSPEKIIYLGTACSYPEHLQRSVSDSGLVENDKFPASPESGYGWSKLIGEIEFKLAYKNSRTKLITLDLHNVYGWPCIYSDSTSQVIPALIYKALTNEELSVWGDGKQGRAFVEVNDVVEAVKDAINYKGERDNFMIGPKFCSTISEIANIIINNPLTKSSRVIFDTSKPVGDVGRFSKSIISEDDLTWAPEVNISEGIHSLISEIKNDMETRGQNN